MHTGCVRATISQRLALDIRKGVISHQLKTVIGGVMDKPLLTEDGEEIDIIFGAKSVGARVVESVYQVGTTITLLKLIEKNALSIYEGS